MKATLNFTFFYEALTLFLTVLLGYSFYVPESIYQVSIDSYITFFEIANWILILVLSLLSALFLGKDMQLTAESKRNFNENKEKFLKNTKKYKRNFKIRSLLGWFLIFFVAVFVRDGSLLIVLVLSRSLTSIFFSGLMNGLEKAIEDCNKYNKGE